MSNTRIQSILMGHIKRKHPRHTAEKIMKVLNISRSNAYKRLNGHKPLSLDETYKLCYHLDLKLEDILPKSDGQVVVNMASIDKPFETIEDYPNYLLRLLTYINRLDQAELIYLTNEIPVCYFFTSPLLAAFKMYMWSRNTFHNEDLANRTFQPRLIIEGEQFSKICKGMITLYENIPRTEIWTGGILKRSLSQFLYCQQAGLFGKKETIIDLTAELKRIVQKNLSNQPDYTKNAKMRLLYNQPYFSAEDIIFIKSPSQKRVISTFFNPDYFISSDYRLINKSEKRLQHFINKSNLIAGEVQRDNYLSGIIQQIDDFLRLVA